MCQPDLLGDDRVALITVGGTAICCRVAIVSRTMDHLERRQARMAGRP